MRDWTCMNLIEYLQMLEVKEKRLQAREKIVGGVWFGLGFTCSECGINYWWREDKGEEQSENWEGLFLVVMVGAEDGVL